MKVGSLTRITYPTGGYTDFIYEANDYGAVGQTASIPTGISLPQSISLSVGPHEGTQTTTFTVGGTDTTSVAVGVSMWPPSALWEQFGIACSKGDTLPDIACPYVTVVGAGSGRWSDDGTYTFSLLPGTYTLKASNLGREVSVLATVEWRDAGIAMKKKTAGGLRVAEVRSTDGIGNTTVRKYRYTLQGDTTRSSGIVDHEPAYSHFYTSGICQYFSRASMSKLPLGDGAPVGYREVTILHGANGEYGRTRHTFRSVTEMPDYFPVYSIWPFTPRTSYAWMRGQPIETAEIDSGGRVQQRTRSAHAFKHGDLEMQSQDSVAIRRFRGMSIHTFSGFWGELGTYEYYYGPFEIISGWTYTDTVATTNYSEAGSDSVKYVKAYTYGNPVHLQPTRITETNSDGKQRITFMKYPADYAIGYGNPEAQALSEMQGSAHMHSQVIERLISERQEASEAIVQGEITTFKLFDLGRILPYQRFILASPSPVQ